MNAERAEAGGSRTSEAAQMPAVTVLVALGANIGDPPRQLRRAVDALSSCLHVDDLSSLYITEPVGLRQQPDFFNMVLRGRTDLRVLELLACTQEIERKVGRTEGIRYGPRPIDIDLLSYGELVLSSESLVVPHPWLHRRSFVLVPLAEIAPDWRHPVLRSTAAEMLAELRSPTAVRRAAPLEHGSGSG